MRAFTKSAIIGANGVQDLLPLIRRHAHEGQFVLTDKGRLSIILQKTAGDVLFNAYNARQELAAFGIEIKTDTTDSLNFFFETWSNQKRGTVGWMLTLQADYLWYYFRERGTVYSINLPQLQEWGIRDKNFERYSERMAKVDQPNDSWGRCVPIDVIKEEIGFKVFYRAKDFPPPGYLHPVVVPSPPKRPAQRDLF